jgi:chemotaxis protein CheX
MADNNTVDTLLQSEIVAAIRSATSDVFSTMLSMEVAAEEGFTQGGEPNGPASGVVSLIGLAGSWVGTGSLVCSADLACKLSSQFLMSEFEAVNDEVLDAVAEITNMIIGNVKTVIEEKVGAMGLSTPTVIYGRNFQTRSARIHEWTVVPFLCFGERLFVQMCLAPNGAAALRTVRPGFQLPQILNA